MSRQDGYDPDVSAATEAGAFGSRRRRLLLSFVIAVIGIALSCLFSALLLRQEKQLARVQFQYDAEKRVEAIQQTLNDRLSTIGTIATYFAGSELVDRKEFDTFVNPLLQNREGVQALGWAPRIQAAERQAHERFVRGEGYPKYEIARWNGQGQVVPAGMHAVYYPVLFIKPSDKNQWMLGLDIESNPKYRAAIRRATSAGHPPACTCIAAEGDAEDRDLLCAVALARNDVSKGTKRPDDQPGADGYVFGLFHVGDIVEAALRSFSPVGIDVSVLAPSSDGGETPIYTRPSPLHAHEVAQPAERSPGDVPYVGEITVGGAHWKIECVPGAIYWVRYRTSGPMAVLLACLLVTALMVGYLWLLTGRAARVAQLVAERTRALQESERRFRRLVDNAGDAFFLHTDLGKILDVNNHACESLQYSREELLTMTLADIDADYVAKDLEHKAMLEPEAYPLSFEGVHRRKDGSTFPVEIRLNLLISGQPRIMLGLVRDVTDRKQAEQALRREQRLLREMIELQDQDRKLVAYEIHDGLAQQLAGAIYKFQSIDQLRDSDPDAAREMFDAAIRALREAMAETRRLIGGLRPPILDESGLIDAIDYLIAEQSQRGGPEIEFIHPPEFARLAAPLESAIFRVVQECLTNACRYSQSERVRVELGQPDGRVRIEVRDWGIGFDPTQVDRDHYGLQGIRERARLLGGAATIDSAPGQGTCVTVSLPLLSPIENGMTKKGMEPRMDVE